MTGMTNRSSRKLFRIASVAAPFLLVGLASAQTEGRRYTDNAVGVGVGLNRVGGQGIVYFTGNYRFNWWDDESTDIEQAIRSRGRSRMRGFLEAEVGYWKDAELVPFESDLLLGLNLIGVLPTRAVDVFFGGGVDVHFIGESDLSTEPEVEQVEGGARFGANIQFGVDMNFTEPFAVFALGRYDILEGDIVDFQAKVLFGGRFRF